MNISKLYKKIALLSPYLEVAIRQLYWRNVSKLKRFKPNKAFDGNHELSGYVADFDKIIDYLKSNGVKKGDIIIVHSSYDSIQKTQLSPEEIIDQLIDLVGSEGTVAMPAIRKYPNTPKYEDILNNEKETVRVYDTRKTRVTSGLLPYTLLKRNDCFVSRFPLNPMVAVGALAEEMMKNNIDGELPSAHGPNSSWKFCHDHKAFVIGLGVNLALCNTITHVAEEAFPGWPINNWYKKSTFIIKDGTFECRKVINERRLEKSLMHYAEFNLMHDILENKILKEDVIDGIKVGLLQSQVYISFIKNHKHKGYPYYNWK